MSTDEIFRMFCESDEAFASTIVDYEPWGANSIMVTTNNGIAYKVKYSINGYISKQQLSKEDIRRKYNQ